MNIIDPNKIAIIKFKGVRITGRILSVGIDGIFDYDYSHPQDAYNAANSGDIILIYPGVYAPKSDYTVLHLNRNINIFIRGMGIIPDDVLLITPSTIWHPVCIESTAANISVVIENLKTFAGRQWSGSIVHRQCSPSTVVLLNKLYISATDYGYVVSFGEDYAGADYQGDCYITNCTIQKGYSHLRKVGAGSSSSIISVQKTLYSGGDYYCASCSRNPSPHDYVITNTTNYGYLYGKVFFEILTESVFKSDLTPKRNIWFREPYIYKATASGVGIYNAVSQDLINHTAFSSGANSVWANDDHLYIATSISGIYRCPVSTVSGIPLFEEYKSYPDITANHVNYIHGCGDYLCTATISGIDRYTLSDNTRTYTTKDYISKCFQTSNGDYYYVVNPFNNVLGLDDNIFNWDYGRTVTLSTTTPEDYYSFVLEIPKTQPDDIYLQSQAGGVDIRVVDDKGMTSPCYVGLWDYVAPPKIWITLSSGVEMFYVLYGNPVIKEEYYDYDYESLWWEIPTISGHTISRGQSINDLFDAAELHAVYNSGDEYVYESKKNSLVSSSYINDIYVTENTSRYENGNVIFLATSWGAVVIEEKRGDEVNGVKRRYLI